MYACRRQRLYTDIKFNLPLDLNNFKSRRREKSKFLTLFLSRILSFLGGQCSSDASFEIMIFNNICKLGVWKRAGIQSRRSVE
jgi:hypothetical protein